MTLSSLNKKAETCTLLVGEKNRRPPKKGNKLCSFKSHQSGLPRNGSDKFCDDQNPKCSFKSPATVDPLVLGPVVHLRLRGWGRFGDHGGPAGGATSGLSQEAASNHKLVRSLN